MGSIVFISKSRMPLASLPKVCGHCGKNVYALAGTEWRKKTVKIKESCKKQTF